MYYHKEQVQAMFDALKATGDKVKIVGLDFYVIPAPSMDLPEQIMDSLAQVKESE